MTNHTYLRLVNRSHSGSIDTLSDRLLEQLLPPVVGHHEKEHRSSSGTLTRDRNPLWITPKSCNILANRSATGETTSIGRPFGSI